MPANDLLNHPAYSSRSTHFCGVPLRTKRSEALKMLSAIIRREQAIALDAWIRTMIPAGGVPKESAVDRANHFHGVSLQIMQIMDTLQTETLVFVADHFTNNTGEEGIHTFLSIFDLKRLNDLSKSNLDLDRVIKNVVSYRHSKADLTPTGLNILNDVRVAGGALDCQDLFLLTGDDRKLAERIMAVSSVSHSDEFSRVHPRIGTFEDLDDFYMELDAVSNKRHITPELALLLKEDAAWTGRVIEFIQTRGITAYQASPELVSSYYEDGALSLNNGML